jgi:NAD(P)-dependent dehydrogenase (short-subunit alcohol dehydrogenase family)
VDVASATAVQLFVKSVFDKHGRIDIAIANAGVIDKPLAVQAIAVERFQRVMRTNVDGVFHLLRAVLPVFIAQGHGLIAIIGSRAGHRGHPKLSSYCASKFAVRGLFESLSRELSEARLPIETILFSPAAVDTEMRAVLDDVCSGRKHQSPHRVAELMIEIMTATRGLWQGMEVTIADRIAVSEIPKENLGLPARVRGNAAFRHDILRWDTHEMCHGDGTLLVNYVVRRVNLESELKVVVANKTMNLSVSRHDNRTAQEHYSLCYWSTPREAVADFFAYDISQWGYELQRLSGSLPGSLSNILRS